MRWALYRGLLVLVPEMPVESLEYIDPGSSPCGSAAVVELAHLFFPCLFFVVAFLDRTVLALLAPHPIPPLMVGEQF